MTTTASKGSKWKQQKSLSKSGIRISGKCQIEMKSYQSYNVVIWSPKRNFRPSCTIMWVSYSSLIFMNRSWLSNSNKWWTSSVRLDVASLTILLFRHCSICLSITARHQERERKRIKLFVIFLWYFYDILCVMLKDLSLQGQWNVYSN